MPVVKLGPWSGVDARTVDDRALNTHPIRGGYNVEIHGGELWWRHGYAPLNFENPIPLAQEWDLFLSVYVEGSLKEFLINRYCVFEILSSGLYSVPYNATVTENVTFVAGSTAVVSTTPWVVGDVVNDPFTNQFYIIVSAVGVNGVIDRPAATGGTAVTSRFAKLSASSATDACTFKQGITHAANAVWAGNLAVAPDEVYLVICFGTAEPIAIRIDASAAVLREFFRDTSPAAGAAVALTAEPPACCVHESRLILAGGGDNASMNRGYCFWYSMPRDLMAWHTGTQAVDAVPNVIRLVEDDDPITAAKTLGDRLIIHRKYSQEIAAYTGAIDLPYRLERNNQMLGCGDTKQIAVTERKHFIMTHRGPAIFDGAEVRLFGDEVKDIFERAGRIGLSGRGDYGAVTVFAFDSTARVMFTHTGVEDYDAVSLGYTQSIDISAQVLIYDAISGQWATCILPGNFGIGCAGSSQRKGVGPRQYNKDIITLATGEILSTTVDNSFQYGFDAWTGKTGRTYAYKGRIVSIVPGMIRTGWMDLGSASQKMLTKLEVELRDTFRIDGSSHRGVYLPGVGQAPYGQAFILHLNIYRDFDLTQTIESLDIAVPGNLFSSETNQNRGFGGEPIRKIRRSLRSQGDVFAFEFSNWMTTESTQAGFQEAVFRIVQALITFTDTQSPRRVNVNEGRPL